MNRKSTVSPLQCATKRISWIQILVKHMKHKDGYWRVLMRHLRFSRRCRFKSWSCGLWPWRRRQQGPPKRWYPTTSQYTIPQLDVSHTLLLTHKGSVIYVGWVHLAQDRELWALVNTVTNRQV